MLAACQAPTPGAAPTPASDAGEPSNVRHLESGDVRGAARGDTVAFKGIPYATPPVGRLRWKPPEAAIPWGGVRDASTFGATCVQQSLETGAPAGGSEDCLTLNVWVPSDREAPPEGFPVMVYIHGGFFTRGSASEKLEDKEVYDGRALAERGHVIVVTLNYRLGALGYLAHSALAKESSFSATGNYGGLDQIAALAWVQRNIPSLSGNPKNVTVFGQSAGGYATCSLVTSPLAKGLFSRAIIHSGNCSTRERSIAEAQGDAVATALGCEGTADVVACMREKRPEEVVGAKAPNFTAGATFSWGPTVDGYMLPSQPYALIGKGLHNQVSLIIGVTALEFSSLWASAYPTVALPKTESEYRDVVNKLYGSTAAETLTEHYPLSEYASPAHAVVSMASDISFVCPARAYARLFVAHQKEPVRRFVFSHGFDSGSAKTYGAGHGFDLFYVFRLFPFSFWTPSEREIALSDTMTDYWTQFATTGDPNGTVPWLPYDPASDSYLDLDVAVRQAAGFRKAQCDFIDSI